jgi:hypothetical protein
MTETSVSHFCGSRDTKKGGVFPWMFLFYKPHLRIESQESRASGHFFLFCFNFPAQPLDDRASSQPCRRRTQPLPLIHRYHENVLIGAFPFSANASASLNVAHNN